MQNPTKTTPMSMKPMNEKVSQYSQGIFNSLAWIQEGDGLYASARTTRAIWYIKRREHSKKIDEKYSSVSNIRNWHLIYGLPKSSVLILAYSVEIYLKAGLAKLFVRCDSNLLETAFKKYGHNLKDLARALEFPLDNESSGDLDELKKYIIHEARYPITPDISQGYLNSYNKRNAAINDANKFKRLCSLAKRIRAHSAKIDSDKTHPAYMARFVIQPDGYIAIRIGGGLKTRITYRLSSVQITKNQTSASHIKAVLKDHAEVYKFWYVAEVYEDTGHKGKREATLKKRRNSLQELSVK